MTHNSLPDPIDQLLAQVQIDIQNHPKQEITLAMNLPEALSLLALMQLVLRRPDLPDKSAQVAREIATSLEREIAITSALKELIAMGWDPKYDYGSAEQERKK